MNSLASLIDSLYPNVDKENLMKKLKMFKSDMEASRVDKDLPANEMFINELAALIDFLSSTYSMTNNNNSAISGYSASTSKGTINSLSYSSDMDCSSAALTSAKYSKGWNLKLILDSVKSIFPGINWRVVYEKALYRNKRLSEKEFLRNLVEVWIALCGTITVPYEIFFQQMNEMSNACRPGEDSASSKHLVEFYKLIIDNSPGNLSLFSNCVLRKIVTKDEFKSKYKRNIEYDNNLNCGELFESISEIKDIGALKELIEYIKSMCPEYCVLGLSTIVNENGREISIDRSSGNPAASLVRSMFLSLLTYFAEGSTSHFIFYILFNRSKENMVKYLGEICNNSITNTSAMACNNIAHGSNSTSGGSISLTRCLDIILEHKVLSFVLEMLNRIEQSSTMYFCYDLVVLACRRDHLNLEFWLNEGVNVDTLISYMNSKIQDNESKSNGINSNGIFPLNKSIIAIILNHIDKKGGSINNPATASLINLIRNTNIEVPTDKATSFLSEIIHSNRSVSESVIIFQKLSKEDPSLCKKIFNTLLDNYGGLYKLANSDMIGRFYGSIIKSYYQGNSRSGCTQSYSVPCSSNIRYNASCLPYLKLFCLNSLTLLKSSLVNSQNDREYTFAFRILEMFYNDVPGEFVEIESIIRGGLIKRELIVVDDDSLKTMKLDELLNHKDIGHADSGKAKGENLSNIIFNQIIRENLVRDKKVYVSKLNVNTNELSVLDSYTKEEIGRILIEKVYQEVNSIITDTKHYDSSYIFDQNSSSNYAVDQNSLASFNYSISSNYTIDQIADFVLHNPELYHSLVYSVFQILNRLFFYRISMENQFTSALGVLLGKIILLPSNVLSLDTFDAHDYLYKSIEYRRIRVSVSFICSFLSTCSKSIIYSPNNPWLMSLLDLLSEIHSYTLFPIRESILKLYKSLDVPFKNKNYKKNLCQYNIVNTIDASNGMANNTVNNVVKVISLALDFSIRESAVIVDGYVEIVKKTIEFLEPRLKSNGIRDQTNIKYLSINLIRPLLHINSQEVLKTSIFGNVTHFLKLAQLEMDEGSIIRLMNENIGMCIGMMESVAITRMKENVKELPMGSDDNAASDGGSRKPFSSILLLKPSFTQRKYLRKVENNEFQEIRSYLIALGRHTPIKKRNYIYDEFPGILGPNKFQNFKKMILYLEGITTKDEECFELAKYLVGEIMKREKDEMGMAGYDSAVDSTANIMSHSSCNFVDTTSRNIASNNFLFEFLEKIFNISYKTKKETALWLIYTQRKSVHLVKKFIEYDFICIEELDKSLGRQIGEEEADGSEGAYKENNGDKSISSLEFAIELLESLIYGDYVLCSVYDFIHTIEAISNRDQNSEILKKIETSMMDFSEANMSSNIKGFGKLGNMNEGGAGVGNPDISSGGASNIFDEFVSTAYSIPSASLHYKFKERYKLQHFDFRTALKSSWQHFVGHSGDYRFYKIDALAYLCKHNLLVFLYNSLEFLIQAYKKKIYIYNVFFCRFFIKILDNFTNNYCDAAGDNANSSPSLLFLFNILEILSPEHFPSFSTHFIEVVNHPYWNSAAEHEQLLISKSLLWILKYNGNYEFEIYKYFSKRKSHVKKYNLFLMYLCPNYCVNLKNLFSQYKEELTFNDSSTLIGYATPAVQSWRSGLSNSFFSKSVLNFTYMDVVDHIALASPKGGNSRIKSLIDDRHSGEKPKEFILSILTRYYGRNAPDGIKIAYDSICRTHREMVKEFEAKYFIIFK